MSGNIKAFVRLDSLKREHFDHGDLYESEDAPVADPLGLTQLGAAYTVVPPGKTACPFHVHHGEDEMFVLLAGEGEYRFGQKRFAVAAGDVLGAPMGGPELAHQLLNIGDGPLVYLSISSKADIDVCEYPDSGKFAVMSGQGNRREHGKKWFNYIGRQENSLNYFDGEPSGAPTKDV